MSKLGRIGGRQELSLGNRCADNVGTPLHELMHAIGNCFEAEHFFVPFISMEIVCIFNN